MKKLEEDLTNREAMNARCAVPLSWISRRVLRNIRDSAHCSKMLHRVFVNRHSALGSRCCSTQDPWNLSSRVSEVVLPSSISSCSLRVSRSVIRLAFLDLFVVFAEVVHRSYCAPRPSGLEPMDPRCVA